MATLEQFLRTGQLGPIRPGMSESEVRQILGPPMAWTGGKNAILAFGVVQLFFSRSIEAKSELHHIFLEISQEELQQTKNSTPRSLWPLQDFQSLSPATTLDEFREFLDAVGLLKVAELVDHGDAMQEFVIRPSARITFHGEKVYSISFMLPAPPTKQISLSLSEETMNRLRCIARESKKSVSSICAEWITQQAQESHSTREKIGSRE